MTQRFVLLAFALVIAQPAAALICAPTEYAQYKDRVATPEGRAQVAMDYCLYRMIYDMEVKSGNFMREMNACSTEIAKIGDSFAAQGHQAYFKDVVGHCHDKYGAQARAKALQSGAAQPAARSADPPGSSKYAYAAERTAKDAGCQAPAATLNASTATFVETFTVSCDRADPLTIRCEGGNCRVLK